MQPESETIRMTADTPPQEPLADSAPLARRIAARCCRRDPATGETCAWYHGLWQYLRLLDIGTVPGDHGAFFADALRAPLGERPRPRILISGAADYGTLAQVLRACRRAGTDADITVVDICATPILLCRWYARRTSTRLATTVADILDYAAPAPFDMVCTHSFLGNFDGAARRRLVARWRDLLRPGGRVVTVNRIRAADSPVLTSFTPEQTEALLDRLRTAAARGAPGLDLDGERLLAMARAYAERKRTFTVRSPDEMRALFTDNGFAVERFEAGAIDPASPGPLQGPTIRGGSVYGMIVATRR